MQITIIKSDNKIDNIDDFKAGGCKVFAFEILEPEKLTHELGKELMGHAFYQLFTKEKSQELKKEMDKLIGKNDPESLKRMGELIDMLPKL